jgi:site-specific DNA-methyltransferase (adenine-specific)
MFSFVGDTVLDPFCGSATTLLAAMKCGRSSIGVEVDATYCDLAARRLNAENTSLFSTATLSLKEAPDSSLQAVAVCEDVADYAPKPRPRGRATRASRR